MNASISDINGNTSGTNVKSGIGCTRVHLRYHKKEEYDALLNEQKNEIREWHAKQRNKASIKRSDHGKKRQKQAKAFASAVEKAMNRIAEGHTAPTAVSASAPNVSSTEMLAGNLLKFYCHFE